ncbi:lysine N(6)-hydroxylase/L-ornithine N(5)-oxygenase family protein [Duganella sp. HH105]|uniref:lysine N(6)-hydroxylase/L-ornithine N(5)-oxygenase family protein n=1 Tax=Duganella sp. HH105 TaxID=1781067 RepID=UPI000877C3E4|nr:lysine N(6)-hydroxylase/L-ornithine N(5)-oxygenase family protein [Duganella sp. HH105]OEZ64145.1 L-ornithine 5-monooxygenase [Duganella sp. HH105]
MLIHDLIGIGFGPSNIALAIALDEQRQAGASVNALFIERQESFHWHPNMLLDNTHMQISFLKDLATMRNPSSPFTFVNYLHQKGRLHDFINLKTFYPSRHEFSNYFAWAAAQFDDLCVYGEEVFEVLPEVRDGEVKLLRVRSHGAGGEMHERLTRNLVVSVGGTANVPECFRPFKDDPRIFHSHHYLHRLAANAEANKIAIIGGGQSAAEIFMDLHGRPNAPQIDLVMRARTIKPADDSPFVNEVFNPDFVDHMFSRSAAERSDMLREFRHTNYASPDLDLIRQLFKIFYEQKVAEQARHQFLRRHEVKTVRADANGVHLTLYDQNGKQTITNRYDAVVLATGYQRAHHKALLEPLAPWLGELETDRDYRILTAPQFRPSIFLQGASEASHGLSDTLLSVTAVRTGEIGTALLAAQPAARRVAAGAL